MDKKYFDMRETHYTVNFTVDGQKCEASLGMGTWDSDLARGMIADRLGRPLAAVTGVSKQAAVSRDVDSERCPNCTRIVYSRGGEFHCDYCGRTW